ncbi:MAG: methylmalonyl-CoA mutase family protein, partial [Fimbriimonadaceae bacterium]
MADQKNEKLFADFPPITDEQWRAVVEKDLTGADFEKKLVKQTPEGVKVRPYYRSGDLPEEEWVRDAKPGQAPFLRGYHADHNDWAIRQAVHETDVKQANMMARRTHERGAQEVSFVMFPGGPEVKNVTDMQQLLDGLDLENTPCFFNSGPLAAAHLALFVAAAERKGSEPKNLKAGVDVDPISDKISGALQGDLGDWVNETKQPLEWAIKNSPEISVLGIRSRTFQEAGATMVQELAYTLSLFVEYISGLTDAGLKADDVVNHTEFRFAVGGNYLLEIAKVRAFRVLLARVLEAYGVGENVRPRLHASTTRSNKTIYDPYVNMLRVSTEAMSAALGGVDSITVLPFDAPFHVPDEFSKRIARNS